jgi:carboxypeptidase C (cathepsin A)
MRPRMKITHGIVVALLPFAILVAAESAFDPGSFAQRELVREDFADATWRERWQIEGNADFSLHAGRLHAVTPLTAPGVEPAATLWLRQALPADVLIEFTAGAAAVTEENACNLNVFLHATEPDGSPYRFGRSGNYGDYHKIPNYIMTLTGGFQAGWARLRRDPGFELLSEEQSTRSEPGKTYRFRILIQKGRIRQWIDDRLIHDAVDPHPLPGGQFGLRTWRSRVWWSDLRICAVEPAQPQSAANTQGYKIKPTLLDLPGKDGTPRARIFSTGYFTKESSALANRRPVVFAFNGGPGSSSVWWHLGGIGPRRVNLLSSYEPRLRDENQPLADNPNTWLTDADLVFVDPVLTGYSRPASGQDKTAFLGYTNDCDYLADFVVAYAAAHGLGHRPLVLAGGSYGAIRVVGIARALADRHHQPLAGLILTASVLNQQFMRASPGNPLPAACALPTYAALRHWHQGTPFTPQARAEVEQAALARYLPDLLRPDALASDALASEGVWLAGLTGLKPSELASKRLRFGSTDFAQTLGSGLAVGRVDGRMVAPVVSGVRDLALEAIKPLFERGIAMLLSSETGFAPPEGLAYLTYNPTETRPWSYAGAAENEYLDTATTLIALLREQPGLRVWQSNGLYDLDGCYFAGQLAFAPVKASAPDRAILSLYDAGHMIYLDPAEAPHFAADARAFLRTITPPQSL